MAETCNAFSRGGGSRARTGHSCYARMLGGQRNAHSFLSGCHDGSSANRWLGDDGLLRPYDWLRSGDAVNVARNKTATADSTCSPNEGPAKAINGTWTGGFSDMVLTQRQQVWQVDLLNQYPIGSVTIRHAETGGEGGLHWNTRPSWSIRAYWLLMIRSLSACSVHCGLIDWLIFSVG